MDLHQATSRCWAEIDLDRLKQNFHNAQTEIAGNAQIIPVLKANAYGMGSIPVARALMEVGADEFAVASFQEAMELRRAIKDCRLLVMGMTGDCDLRQAVEEKIAVTVFDTHQPQLLSEIACQLGLTAHIELKLDTGLHRLGFDCAIAADQISGFACLPGLSIDGLFTHLALRDAQGDRRQFELFHQVADQLKVLNIHPKRLHMSDSIGMVRYPQQQLNAVRLGAYLFGVAPSGYAEAAQKVLSICDFKTRVVQIRWVEAGECIGYDEDHPLKERSLIATLSAGYVDGFPRTTGVGEVEIRGRRAPVVGLVCMDQMMVDVGRIPGVQPGDEAILLGGGISIKEYADLAQLNRNEAYSRINRRVPRVYYSGGIPVQIVDYMNTVE